MLLLRGDPGARGLKWAAPCRLQALPALAFSAGRGGAQRAIIRLNHLFMELFSLAAASAHEAGIPMPSSASQRPWVRGSLCCLALAHL